MKELRYRRLLSLSTSVLALAALTITSAHAKPNHPNRGNRDYNRGHQSQKVNLQANKQLVNEALRLTNNYRFRRASSTLFRAKMNLSRLKQSPQKVRIMDALRSSIRKLDSRRLTAGEKVNAVRENTRVINRALNRLMDTYDSQSARQELRSSIDKMNRAAQLVRSRENKLAVQKLNRIMEILEDYDNDRSIREALETVRTLKKRIRNPELRQKRKIRIAERLSGEFSVSVKSSRYFKQNHSNNSRVNLGRTEKFKKGRYKTQRMPINANGAFKAITIKAVDDAVFISEMVIVFGNGRRQVVSGVELYEGQSRQIDLHGEYRRIQRLVITATSPVFWGTDSRLQVFGIR
jgi:hypothetical protein